MTRQPWIVRETLLAVDTVFTRLGPLPWTEGVPPASWIESKAVELNRREPQHSPESWNAKMRDVVSCLPLPTQRKYAGRPEGSHRKVKAGAKSATVEGPSTQELVAQRLRELETNPPNSLIHMIGAVIKDVRNLKKDTERIDEALQVILHQAT